MRIGLTSGWRHANTSIKALPEFGPVRVDVQVEALGLSAEEVENLITNPMENEFFNGIPWLAKLESRTMPGLSSMEMTFEPGTDPIRARQVVQEGVTMSAMLPAAASKPPLVVQPLSSTSRLMMIGLSSEDLSLIDMSLLSRWTIVPRLLSVPGVANVTIWGFRDRQLQVQVDPSRLTRNGVTLDQMLRTSANALWVSPLTFVEASTPGTGGFIDTADQRIEIQHNQPIKTAQDLAKVTIQGAEDRGLRLGDVATIVEDHQLLIGDALVNDSPSLMLVVERFPGAKVVDVTQGVEAALDELRPGLPGLNIDTTVYRPASFIEKMVDNLVTTLILGAILLVLVLGAFLFNWRTALVSLVTIGVSVALTVLVLSWFGIVLNMMSLAGLIMALAIVVDDAVVGVENIRHRLRQRRDEPAEKPVSDTIRAAVLEMRGPLAVAAVIAAATTVPLFILDGVRGDFFTPVAQAFLIATAVSLVVALTVAPVLATALLAKTPPQRRESPLAERLERAYGAQLEGRRCAHGLDDDVRAEPVRDRPDHLERLAVGIDREVRAELLDGLESAVRLVDPMMCDGEKSRAVRIAARPIGPAPTTTTVSPGRTWPLSTPTSYAVGRMAASMTAASFGMADGSLCSDRSANGMRAYCACTPSIRCLRIQPPPPRH